MRTSRDILQKERASGMATVKRKNSAIPSQLDVFRRD
jgi:hypothetical protein